jgi:hypothetical protein
MKKILRVMNLLFCVFFWEGSLTSLAANIIIITFTASTTCRLDYCELPSDRLRRREMAVTPGVLCRSLLVGSVVPLLSSLAADAGFACSASDNASAARMPAEERNDCRDTARDSGVVGVGAVVVVDDGALASSNILVGQSLGQALCIRLCFSHLPRLGDDVSLLLGD